MVRRRLLDRLRERRAVWDVLHEAGLVLIVIMGIVLIALSLAIGLAIGMDLI